MRVAYLCDRKSNHLPYIEWLITTCQGLPRLVAVYVSSELLRDGLEGVPPMAYHFSCGGIE